ncbi:zinc finger protein 888-like [Condylostylus longicornis]|uniref:zinc finger protein 888-like n=1 Tax=Condylostylus longicornis TaxID=2530218 RepID=UPI00244E55AF|nr:zinc finger protein 888-like [Condylostylus longicornis]
MLNSFHSLIFLQADKNKIRTKEMNKNESISLLKKLMLLAILKRQRNRRKKKNFESLNKTKNSYENAVDNIGLVDYHNKVGNESESSENDFANESYSSSSSCNIKNKNSECIITYSFDKHTKAINKTLIHRDNTELKEIRELTSKITYRRVICDICGKSFNEKNFRFHLNMHNNHFPYKCMIDNCRRAFTSAQMLKQHQKFHVKEKCFKCEFCDRTFYMPSSLKKHRLLHFDPTIECQKCGKKFHTKSSLKMHMEKIHLRIKKFVCNICDRPYFNQSSLRNHLMVTHKQEFTSQRIAK